MLKEIWRKSHFQNHIWAFDPIVFVEEKAEWNMDVLAEINAG
jgi:hypothetical protein